MDVTFAQRAPTPERLLESTGSSYSGGGVRMRQPTSLEAEDARLRLCQSKRRQDSRNVIKLINVHNTVSVRLYLENLGLEKLEKCASVSGSEEETEVGPHPALHTHAQ